MDDNNKTILDNELILSKLSGGVGYCEIEIDNKLKKVVILGGTPVDFRIFNMVALTHITGGVYNYIDRMNSDILAFWELIGYTDWSIGKNSYSTASQNNPIISNFSSISSTAPNWGVSDDYSVLGIVLAKLQICSQNPDEKTKSDLLPIMAQVSQTEKTYRI